MTKKTLGSIIDLTLNKNKDGFDLSVYVTETNENGLPLFEQAVSNVPLNLYKYENKTLVSNRDEDKLDKVNEFMLSKFDLTFDEMLKEFSNKDSNPFEDNDKDRNIELYYNDQLLPKATFYLQESTGGAFKKYDRVKDNRKGNVGKIKGITILDGRVAIEVESTKDNTVSQENGEFVVKLPGCLYVTPIKWVNGVMKTSRDAQGNPLPNTVDSPKLIQTLSTMLMLFGTINPKDFIGKDVEYTVQSGTRLYGVPKKVTPLSDEFEAISDTVYDDVSAMINSTKGKYTLIPEVYKKHLTDIIPTTVTLEMVTDLRVGEDLDA